MSKNQYKPGPGWSHLGGAVYAHSNNCRIHVMGLCRLPNGYTVLGSRWPESREVDRLIAINGGNRRRGVIAWARRLTYMLLLAISLTLFVQ